MATAFGNHTHLVISYNTHRSPFHWGGDGAPQSETNDENGGGSK